MWKFGMTSLALLFSSGIGVAGVAAYGLCGGDAPNGPSQGTIAPADRYHSPQITEADVKVGPAPRAEAGGKHKSPPDRQGLAAAVDKGIAKSVAAEGIRLSNGRSAWGHNNGALLGYGSVVAVKLPK